jgi:hypothetical protein
VFPWSTNCFSFCRSPALTGTLLSKSDDWDAVPTAGTQQDWNHYVVCLDCGRKMAYDWDHMRIVK